ncbi:MAG: LPS export ABC transporter periplasmic protein LptC [Opitutae bacterium]|nr:LPS export ABC transporter periplasmic protein LptC [Opitutae bacterium]
MICRASLFAAFLLLAAVPAARAQTHFSTNAPIINFRLPTFTPDGHREWLVRGSEARFASQDQVDISELTLSIFRGDDTDKVETMILAPSARVLPGESVVTGEDTIRVINDDFEVTGVKWRYEHKQKRVTIAKNVRVTFRAELKDYLQ